jgi:hypothetical protein
MAEDVVLRGADRAGNIDHLFNHMKLYTKIILAILRPIVALDHRKPYNEHLCRFHHRNPGSMKVFARKNCLACENGFATVRPLMHYLSSADYCLTCGMLLRDCRCERRTGDA